MSYIILNAIFAVWVYLDANKRLNHTIGWPMATVIAGPIVLPIYFAKRNLKAGETREGGTGWNVIRSFAFFWTITMTVLGIAGMATVSNIVNNATSQAEQAGAAIGATLGLGMMFITWLIVLISALIVGLFLKKSNIVENGPTGALAIAIAKPVVSQAAIHNQTGKTPSVK